MDISSRKCRQEGLCAALNYACGCPVSLGYKETIFLHADPGKNTSQYILPIFCSRKRARQSDCVQL